MIVGATAAFISNAAAVTVAAPSFVSLCSSLAAPASVLVSAAPLPTIRQIKLDKDVGDLPLLPYSCMAANCVLWTTYGFLKHTPSIWAPNAVGLALAIYYIHSFIEAAAPDKSVALPESLKWHIGGVGAVVTAAAVAFQCQSIVASSAIADAVGMAAVLFCMALFASPLAALKTVMDTKSADSIPLPFTIASVLGCFLWSVTGLFELHDLNVIFPNAVGFLFGMAQVGLKLRFSNFGKTFGRAKKDIPLLESTQALIPDPIMAAQEVQPTERGAFGLLVAN